MNAVICTMSLVLSRRDRYETAASPRDQPLSGSGCLPHLEPYCACHQRHRNYAVQERKISGRETMIARLVEGGKLIEGFLKILQRGANRE
jgi:hypothetical protein